MATKIGVMAALTLLSRNFAGTVTPEKADVWLAALGDVSDETLKTATVAVIAKHTGDFIPPVAVIREAAGANVKARVDVAGILKQLHALVAYNPAAGHSAPRVDRVRRELGDAIADAYSAIGGGDRLLMSEGTTRAIAERDFAKELESLATERGAAALLPPAPVAPPRLTSGEVTAAIEAPVAVPFDWRAALRPDAPKPDTTKLEEAAAAGDELAAKYLARKRRVAA